MFTPITVIFYCFIGVLFLFAVGLFMWNRIRQHNLPEKMVKKTAQEHGVSEDFVLKAIALNMAHKAGTITDDQFQKAAKHIHYADPEGSGLRKQLGESEGI